MLDWYYNNEAIVNLMLLMSVISFFVSLIIVPVILILIPTNYFLLPVRQRVLWSNRHPLFRIPLLLLKNSLAILFILLGMVMLAIPGQGILTILVGLILLDFPGKYRFERWIVGKESILHGINWIRVKAGKPELILTIDKDEKPVSNK